MNELTKALMQTGMAGLFMAAVFMVLRELRPNLRRAGVPDQADVPSEEQQEKHLHLAQTILDNQAQIISILGNQTRILAHIDTQQDAIGRDVLETKIVITGAQGHKPGR